MQWKPGDVEAASEVQRLYMGQGSSYMGMTKRNFTNLKE